MNKQKEYIIEKFLEACCYLDGTLYIKTKSVKGRSSNLLGIEPIKVKRLISKPGSIQTKSLHIIPVETSRIPLP